MRNKGENICPVCGQNTYFLFKDRGHISSKHFCYVCGFDYGVSDFNVLSEEETAQIYIRRLRKERNELNAILNGYFWRIKGFDAMRKEFNEKMFMGLNIGEDK